jgi:hypothetical protein
VVRVLEVPAGTPTIRSVVAPQPVTPGQPQAHAGGGPQTQLPKHIFPRGPGGGPSPSQIAEFPVGGFTTNPPQSVPQTPAKHPAAPVPDTVAEPKPAAPALAAEKFANLDALAETGKRPVKGGRTHAGREYQKHMDRGEVPRVPGKEFDSAGQALLDGIMKSPTTHQFPLEGGQFKGGNIFVREDGLGAAFDKDGVFRYFGKFSYTGE